jgi:hypothetical protein
VFRVLDTTIDINAPPARVWEVLLDFARWKDWNPFVTSVVGTLAVGHRLHITVSPPGIKSMEFSPKVFAVQHCEKILWGGSFLFVVFRGDHAMLLELLPGGGTRFRQRERFLGPIVLFMGGMISATEQGYHQMNQALKQRAEARPSI